MKHVYGYIRVSTAKQGEGVSLEAQKEAIQAFADRRDLIIAQWFEEKETAAKSGRKVFTEMMKQLKAGKADGLVIHKIDRSARNLKDWAAIGELSDLGIEVFFATETLDFRSRGGRLTADIQAVIAADYIRNLREETIKGIRGRLKQGLYPFKAPIGYRDNGPGQPKTPDPQRAHLIKAAFKLYASGQYSFDALLSELDRRGLRTRQGARLGRTAIEQILRNPFYCGLMFLRQSGETFPGVHEPLISAALFEQVQALKDDRTIKKVVRHDYPFRRLFKCRDCGASMVAERQRGHVYYRCHTRGCPTTTIRQEAIDAGVAAIFETLHIPDAAIQRVSHMIDGFAAEDGLQAALQGLDAQIAQLCDRAERLTDAMIDRIIAQDVYQDRRQKLEIERRHLAEEREHLASETFTGKDVEKFLEHVKSLARAYEISEGGEKRQLIEIATSNREVSAKTLYIQPANWVSDMHAAIDASLGCPKADTSRTFHDWIREAIAHYNRLAHVLKDDDLKVPCAA